MPAITKLQCKFDANKILACLPNLAEMKEFQDNGQLAIRHSETNDSWYDGCGSLYDYEKRRFVANTADFQILNKAFVGTYIEEVISVVNYHAEIEGVKLGRVRILQLKPKTCYSLHIDPEEFRYHIPLVTNEKCFFVNNDVIEYMNIPGYLYQFKTQEMHTAVNASFKDRIHLVFDTFS